MEHVAELRIEECAGRRYIWSKSLSYHHETTLYASTIMVYIGVTDFEEVVILCLEKWTALPPPCRVLPHWDSPHTHTYIHLTLCPSDSRLLQLAANLIRGSRLTNDNTIQNTSTVFYENYLQSNQKTNIHRHTHIKSSINGRKNKPKYTFFPLYYTQTDIQAATQMCDRHIPIVM